MTDHNDVNLSRAYSDIAVAIVTWEQDCGRRYVWREAIEPYPLALAELLLQKTRGDAAEPVWRKLITTYPSAEDLATADVQKVRATVAPLGLGVQRSQRLVAMARALANASGLVPGLGSYGAGVLALAAGNTPARPPVDGNVARVLARLFALAWDRGEARKKPETREAAGAILAAADRPILALYGLVDLGAAVCRPARPHCADCPLVALCAFATSAGGSEEHSIDCADGT